jgi:hypothetical protein
MQFRAMLEQHAYDLDTPTLHRSMIRGSALVALRTYIRTVLD